jgi:pimeloyl-ACP methyl ester carboxylesterase
MEERKLAFAVQGQSYGPMFDEQLTIAAWKTKPTWAIVSAKDRMLPPAMEEAAAKKMGAVTTTLSTCHMVILEEPAKAAEVIQLADDGIDTPEIRLMACRRDDSFLILKNGQFAEIP